MATHEFERIARFVSHFKKIKSPFGPGDDCAVMKTSSHAQLCITTDALVENVHFTRSTFSFEDIGHKALAVNLSDLAAMGAEPTAFTCALQLPENISDSNLDAVAKGMSHLAKRFSAQLIGGNMSRAKEFSIVITAMGTAPRPLLRSSAEPGDLVCVTGDLGNAAAGFLSLQKKKKQLIEFQKRPIPQIGMGILLREHAHACIDVSDGLVQDLGHVAKASTVDIFVETAKLPLSKALLSFFPSQAIDLALHGGEDYALAFTVAPSKIGKVYGSFDVIGEVKKGNGKVFVDGKKSSAKSGFRHF